MILTPDIIYFIAISMSSFQLIALLLRATIGTSSNLPQNSIQRGELMTPLTALPNKTPITGAIFRRTTAIGMLFFVFPFLESFSKGHW